MIAALSREVEIPLYDAQQDFVDDEASVTAFIGGRFSGKSFAGAVKAALRCTEPTFGLICAPNFPMLEHAAKRKFLERLDALGLPYEEHKSIGKLTIPATGAEVVFATLETESRIRGPGFDWAWGDEIEYIAKRATWYALKGAVREGPRPQLFATTTPKGRRLIWEEFVRDASPDYTLHTATTFDNPFIDADRFVRSLRYTGQFYQQEIEAQFVAFEGLVYPAFSRERHMQAVDCAGWATVLGVDVGSTNPTVVLVARYSGERIHIEREFYRRNLMATEILAAISGESERSQPNAVYIDPSAAGYIKDLQQRNVRVVKANNDVLIGIQRVAAVLADGLTIDPSCVETMAEFESYRYPERQSERDVPLKENDHAMDALRYLCQGIAAPRESVRFF